MASHLLVLLTAASLALARTDLSGCTYTDSVVSPSGGDAYATRVWYVPETGEVCAFLDCGGGTAPPKTTVPGCAEYSGTATYSPSYLQLAARTVAPSVETTQLAVETTMKKKVSKTSSETSLQLTDEIVMTSVSDVATELVLETGSLTSPPFGASTATVAAGASVSQPAISASASGTTAAASSVPTGSGASAATAGRHVLAVVAAAGAAAVYGLW